MQGCWNWQTSWPQTPVEQSLWVQVPSPAPTAATPLWSQKKAVHSQCTAFSFSPVGVQPVFLAMALLTTRDASLRFAIPSLRSLQVPSCVPQKMQNTCSSTFFTYSLFTLHYSLTFFYSLPHYFSQILPYLWLFWLIYCILYTLLHFNDTKLHL